MAEKHLNFWTMPTCYKPTMEKKEFQKFLLKHNGLIFSCGKSWDVKSEHIGADVYKVWLVPHVYDFEKSAL